MNGAITWESLAYLVAMGTALGGVWFRMYRNAESIREDLAKFKLEVAKEYATNATIKEVAEAINRLGDRLDRFLEHSRNSN